MYNGTEYNGYEGYDLDDLYTEKSSRTNSVECDMLWYQNPTSGEREDIRPKDMKPPKCEDGYYKTGIKSTKIAKIRKCIVNNFQRYENAVKAGDWISGDVIDEERNRPMKVTDVLFEWSHMQLTDDQRDTGEGRVPTLGLNIKVQACGSFMGRQALIKITQGKDPVRDP